VNFLADECCDAVFVAGLRGDGHDILYVRDAMPGADDVAVMDTAFRGGRIVLTEDKDFGELAVRLRLPAVGLVLSRIDPADTATKLTRMRELIRDHAGRLAGTFTVVEENRFRFRPLPPVP
jgi:predicted nuclease of predicted toxin-antitoxin system